MARGGDDLITLKANHGKADGEVRDWLAAHAFARDARLRPCADAFDDGHSRLVRRRVFACTEATQLQSLTAWPKLGTVLAVETIRGINAALHLERKDPAGTAGRGHPLTLGDRERLALGA